MENLLIIDRQPLLRIGLKLIIESHFPTFKFFEANCRYSIPDSLSGGPFSITLLGFDPDHEEIDPADISGIRIQFPDTQLIVYAGDLPEQQVRHFFDLGIFAYISKQASVDELIKCLQTAVLRLNESRLGKVESPTTC